jgi:hypothetical protein
MEGEFMKLLPDGFYTVELQRIDDGEGWYDLYFRWVFSAKVKKVDE